MINVRVRMVVEDYGASWEVMVMAERVLASYGGGERVL